MGSKGTPSSGKKSLGRDSACCNSEQLWDVRVLGFFSTCFLVTWFLAALQSLSFSDCCVQLSLALCLIDKTARKKPSSLFLSAVAWPRSGLRRRIQSVLTGAVCREFITCCESPTQAAREKDLLYFLPAPGSCCCCETAKTRHHLTMFLFLDAFFSSSLSQYLTSKKHWDTTDFPAAFTDQIPRSVWKEPVDVVCPISCLKQNSSWN